MKHLAPAMRKTVAAALCAGLLCSAAACSRDQEEPVEQTIEQHDEMISRTMLYPNDLTVDGTQPDSVATAFVEIVENHDAATEKEEWASVARATELMTPESAAAYTADFNGGTETRWEDWVPWEAFTTAIPALADDVRPPDTENEVFRIVDAHIQVETPGDHAAHDIVRTHFLMLQKVDESWRVARWNISTPVDKAEESMK